MLPVYVLLFSSSGSSTKSSELLQTFPWQSPQAVTHFNPFLWQEHTLVLQRFLDDSLNLHCTNFNKLSGTASKSVIIGVNVDPSSFNPAA